MRATRDELFHRLLNVVEDLVVEVVPFEDRKKYVNQVRGIREDLWEVTNWETDNLREEVKRKRELHEQTLRQ